MTIREIMDKYGMSLTNLSKRFGIPYRTVQSWAAKEEDSSYRKCPDYITRMIDEILGNEKKEGA